MVYVLIIFYLNNGILIPLYFNYYGTLHLEEAKKVKQQDTILCKYNWNSVNCIYNSLPPSLPPQRHPSSVPMSHN